MEPSGGFRPSSDEAGSDGQRTLRRDVSVRHRADAATPHARHAAADKRQVVFDTPHDVRLRHDDLVREVLAWYDKYLGRVQ
jgi:hypothetical protein